MKKTKTLAERERELQAFMSAPEGPDRLDRIADGYRNDGGRARPPHSSVITYILVHERESGLIRSDACRQNALEFGAARFREQLGAYVRRRWRQAESRRRARLLTSQ